MSEPAGPIQSSKRPYRLILTTRNLSVVITGAAVIVALLKADPKDIPRIVEILFSSNTFAAIGWILAFVFLVGGVVFSRTQQEIHQREIDRLANERDELQKILIGKNK